MAPRAIPSSLSARQLIMQMINPVDTPSFCGPPDSSTTPSVVFPLTSTATLNSSTGPWNLLMLEIPHPQVAAIYWIWTTTAPSFGTPTGYLVRSGFSWGANGVNFANNFGRYRIFAAGSRLTLNTNATADQGTLTVASFEIEPQSVDGGGWNYNLGAAAAFPPNRASLMTADPEFFSAPARLGCDYQMLPCSENIAYNTTDNEVTLSIGFDTANVNLATAYLPVRMTPLQFKWTLVEGLAGATSVIWINKAALQCNPQLGGSSAVFATIPPPSAPKVMAAMFAATRGVASGRTAGILTDSTSFDTRTSRSAKSKNNNNKKNKVVRPVLKRRVQRMPRMQSSKYSGPRVMLERPTPPAYIYRNSIPASQTGWFEQLANAASPYVGPLVQGVAGLGLYGSRYRNRPAAIQ